MDFLKAFHAVVPWVLTAIEVEGNGIDTRTFAPNIEAKASQWIDRYNGNRNLHFSVNVPGRSPTNQASREDIAYVKYLHVDVDARPDQELAQELTRIKKLVTKGLPRGVPPHSRTRI